MDQQNKKLKELISNYKTTFNTELNNAVDARLESLLGTNKEFVIIHGATAQYRSVLIAIELFII